jgi:hypothetical protein
MTDHAYSLCGCAVNIYGLLAAKQWTY